MKTMKSSRALLLVLALLAAPVACYAQAWSVGVSIGIAPPPLPVYVQPPCPAVGYIWTPGYWAHDPVFGYYWVPGTWVLAPAPGLLWTPGYWAFEEGFYSWRRGYWGPRVGFYGGINYGFGYFGNGFAGGHWDHDRFFYNRAVTNVSNVSITNVYNQTVVNNTRVVNDRTSFNGGAGGVQLHASAAEQEAARAARYGVTAEQQRHDSAAHALPDLRASVNHGQPSVAATSRPGVFAGRGVSVTQGRETTTPREPGNARLSRANPAPARPPSERARVDTPRGFQGAPHENRSPDAVRQPAARGNAPEHPPADRSAQPHPAPPYQSAQPHPAPASQYAQRGAPGPSYAARPPMPYRESARVPAPAAPRAAPNPAPARSGPQAPEGGQGPRREQGRD